MKRMSLISGRGLLGAVAALALAVPAASAHDEQSVGGERKAGSTTWTVPVPALPLPTFDLEIDGNEVDSKDLLPSTLDGGTLLMTISGASTSPFAQVAQHCPDGEVGASIAVQRVSPGASIDVYYDPGTRTDANYPYRLGGHKVTEGDKNTKVATDLCQGL